MNLLYIDYTFVFVHYLICVHVYNWLIANVIVCIYGYLCLCVCGEYICIQISLMILVFGKFYLIQDVALHNNITAYIRDI